MKAHSNLSAFDCFLADYKLNMTRYIGSWFNPFAQDRAPAHGSFASLQNAQRQELAAHIAQARASDSIQEEDAQSSASTLDNGDRDLDGWSNIGHAEILDYNPSKFERFESAMNGYVSPSVRFVADSATWASKCVNKNVDYCFNPFVNAPDCSKFTYSALTATGLIAKLPLAAVSLIAQGVAFVTESIVPVAKSSYAFASTTSKWGASVAKASSYVAKNVAFGALEAKKYFFTASNKHADENRSSPEDSSADAPFDAEAQADVLIGEVVAE